MALVFGTAGAGSSAANTSVTPTLPSGNIHDVILLYTYVGGTGTAAGTIGAPAGYNTAYSVAYTTGAQSLMALFWKDADGTEGNPTVTYTGGAASDWLLAQIVRVSGADYVNPIAQVGPASANGSANNIGAITGITIASGNAVLVMGGKRSTWTSAGTLATSGGFTYTEISESTSGAASQMVWDYSIGTGATGNKTFTITGGSANPGGGIMVEIAALPAIRRPIAPAIFNQARQRAATH